MAVKRRIALLLCLMLATSIEAQEGRRGDITAEVESEGLEATPLINIKQNRRFSHPVFFEPLTKVELSRSTYDLMLFYDLKVILEGYQQIVDETEQLEREMCRGSLRYKLEQLTKAQVKFSMGAHRRYNYVQTDGIEYVSHAEMKASLERCKEECEKWGPQCKGINFRKQYECAIISPASFAGGSWSKGGVIYLQKELCTKNCETKCDPHIGGCYGNGKGSANCTGRCRAFKPCDSEQCPKVHYMDKICDAIALGLTVLKKEQSNFQKAIDESETHPSASSREEQEEDIPPDPYASAYARPVRKRRESRKWKNIEKVERVFEKIMAGSKLNRTKTRRKRLLWNFANSVAIWRVNRRITKIQKYITKLRENDQILQQKVEHLALYLNKTMSVLKTVRDEVQLQAYTLVRLAWTVTFNKKAISEGIFLDILWRETMAQYEKMKQAARLMRVNTRFIEENLRVFTSHKLSPQVLSPVELRKVLQEVKERVSMESTRLHLPGDPIDHIWAYYAIITVTPLVVNKALVVILSIPLLDASLKLDVYHVHNLPALHQGYRFGVTFVLEGNYYAVSKSGGYVAAPTDREVELCVETLGQVCVFNVALYPLETNRWCLTALFQDDDTLIQENCRVNTVPPGGNLAVNLKGNVWAVATYQRFVMNTFCPKSNDRKVIDPPLTMVYLPSGCYGSAPSIYLPAKTQLANREEILDERTFYLRFNSDLKDPTNYEMWAYLKLNTTEELDRVVKDFVRDELPDLPAELPIGVLAKKLHEFKVEKTPWYDTPDFYLIMIICAVLVAILCCLGFVYWALAGGKLTFLSKAFSMCTKSSGPTHGHRALPNIRPPLLALPPIPERPEPIVPPESSESPTLDELPAPPPAPPEPPPVRLPRKVTNKSARAPGVAAVGSRGLTKWDAALHYFNLLEKEQGLDVARNWWKKAHANQFKGVFPPVLTKP